jgi:hypothetical protein
MPISMWHFLRKHHIFGDEGSRIVIEKFSATDPQRKLYGICFTGGEFQLDEDGRVSVDSTGSEELTDRVMEALRDNAGYRTVITRYRAKRPRRMDAQLFIDNRGFLHRDPGEGPAYWVRNLVFANSYYAAYCWHGLMHQVGKPASVRVYENKLDQYVWYRFGREHRNLQDGPSYTDQEEPRHFHRKYAMHGHRYLSLKEGGQRKFSDADYSEADSRRAGLSKQSEAPVSWLRKKYEMRGPKPG